MKKINIEVFSSPGCSKCKQARRILKEVVESFDNTPFTWREVNTIEELEYSVEKGIMSTPAILIDNKIVFKGLPTPKELKNYLKKLS